jgi:anaerobic magnesium-protoporphyrin IX monomethyl ester cyclase
MTWIALVGPEPARSAADRQSHATVARASGPEVEENLSLRYLASSLARAGYYSEIVPFSGEHELESALAAILDAAEPPELVGLSLASHGKAADTLVLARELRARGYAGHVTAGGHFATFTCTELLRDFAELDTIVRNEGEQTIVSLVRALEDGRSLTSIPGLAFRSAGGEVVLTALPSQPDLATLPRPDRRGEPAVCFEHRIAPLVSSRGCSSNGTFSCNAASHEQTSPTKCYRAREPDDVAAEMVEMQRERDIEIFVFHDDNFFAPGKRRNLERFHALADALERRGIGKFATVIKARPTDVDLEVFTVLRERLKAIRVDVTIQTDSEQGLKALRRWTRPKQNQRAIDVVRQLDLYCCFNLLAFDPDTTLDSLDIHLDLMRHACDFPVNVGRVELYAGAPLLARMQAEGRAHGDYLHWDYDVHDPDVERVCSLAMAAFRDRNFGADALSNRIMRTRFDMEVCRHFHRERHDPRWRAEGIALSRALGEDSVRALAWIVEHVRSAAPGPRDARLVAELASVMRAAEARLSEGAADLAARVTRALGGRKALTFIADRSAAPLQPPGLV